MKIVVIENDTLLLSVISTVLSREGHEVFECIDGYEGIRNIFRHKPDMVITEIMIPNKSGAEIVHFIRKTLNWDTLIVILSSLGQQRNLEDYFEYGVDEYITKPFSIKEFVVRINKLRNHQS